jgi:HSP20 family protein
MASERTQEQERGEISRYEPGMLANPFSMMRRLSNDIERMFEDVWGTRRVPSLWRGTGMTERWAPDIEVFDRKGELVVRADLPGMTKDEVKVEIADGNLTIQGERREEKERSEKGYYTCERAYGTFFRSIALPEGARVDEAKASFKNGVLEVTMPAPRMAETHGRQLEIKST